MGSGGPSIENVILAADKTRAKSPKRMGPFVVPRTMSSTASATLAVPFKIKGVNYTISSACATSGHCIGNGMELIQLGKQKIVFAGGSDEVHFAMTAMFDASKNRALIEEMISKCFIFSGWLSSLFARKAVLTLFVFDLFIGCFLAKSFTLITSYLRAQYPIILNKKL